MWRLLGLALAISDGPTQIARAVRYADNLGKRRGCVEEKNSPCAGKRYFADEDRCNNAPGGWKNISSQDRGCVAEKKSPNTRNGYVSQEDKQNNAKGGWKDIRRGRGCVEEKQLRGVTGDAGPCVSNGRDRDVAGDSFSRGGKNHEPAARQAQNQNTLRCRHTQGGFLHGAGRRVIVEVRPVSKAKSAAAVSSVAEPIDGLRVPTGKPEAIRPLTSTEDANTGSSTEAKDAVEKLKCDDPIIERADNNAL